MKSKLLHDAHGQRTFALVFDIGDEVVGGLRAFATEHALTASHFTAIGALTDAVLGYFDWKRKEYKRIPVQEQVEVLSMVGNVVPKDGAPQVHAHVVIGKSDGTAHGGHLLEAHVRPTLELIVVESPAYLRREHDEAMGFALIKIPRAA
ncbi:MAG: PPC domain-containing DNA-binding protein [Candidatus Rokuibacteriota bacterium]